MGTCIIVPLSADAQEDMNWHRLKVTPYVPPVLAEFTVSKWHLHLSQLPAGEPLMIQSEETLP